MIALASTQSQKKALDAIRNGRAGLNARRKTMLDRVWASGAWAKFPLNHLKMKDLAYLTAATGHEFAILRGKNFDILFHGDERRCNFPPKLEALLMKGWELYGHSHPGELDPIPSPQDRMTLKKIGQSSSWLISDMSVIPSRFTADSFELL